MTIHITPEPDFSYVSFESNIPEASYKEVIRRVLNTFKPGKFVVTVFANKESVASNCPRELERPGYLNFDDDWLCDDVQYCRFKNYDLTCAFYSKFPSWGCMDASFVDIPDEAKINPPVPVPIPDKRTYYMPQISDFNSIRQIQNNNNSIVHNYNSKNRSNNNNNEKKFSPKRLNDSNEINGPATRSSSTPQLKVPVRSKVYRKTSLKSSEMMTSMSHRIINISNHRFVFIFLPTCSFLVKIKPLTVGFSYSRRNSSAPLTASTLTPAKSQEDVHIICNPLSTPYPYSTPCKKADLDEKKTADPETEDKKSNRNHSCGSFLPILALIPSNVVSFQYLSPKMKFSWWRNKISWRHAWSAD